MFKYFSNIKKQILYSKEIVISKRESMELKKKELEGEMNRWNKEQKRKKLP